MLFYGASLLSTDTLSVFKRKDLRKIFDTVWVGVDSRIRCNYELYNVDVIQRLCWLTRNSIIKADKGSAKYLLFGKCFKKNYWIFTQISFESIMQMAASAGHAVAYTIDPIFKHIIYCVQLYFTNGFTNFVL